jgi:hypothetical protein
LCPLSKAFDAQWANEFAAAVEAGWRMWADDPSRYCDAARIQTVTQMFNLALRHKVLDGDALCVLLYLQELVGPFGARNGTVMQMIDPDRLSNPNMAPEYGGAARCRRDRCARRTGRLSHPARLSGRLVQRRRIHDLGSCATHHAVGPADRRARFRSAARKPEPWPLRTGADPRALLHADEIRRRRTAGGDPADHLRDLHHLALR